MNYFYILINKKENLEILKDTITLINKHCLKDSNQYSVNINKTLHSNCILDNANQQFLHVYSSEINKYELFEKYYLNKYDMTKTDIDVLFKIYNDINIETIEEKKVQVKITYTHSFINALQFIVDLLGQSNPLNQIFLNGNGEIFSQVISNHTESQVAIIENNHIYLGLYDSGRIRKGNEINNNEVFVKYLQYKNLTHRLAEKNIKELRKI